MKVNEIEINGKIYCTTYIKNSNDCNICEHCDLKFHCDNAVEDDIVFKLCQENPFKWCFKEVKTIKNDFKFYTFSSGTVFNTNYIKDIINVGYVKTYPIELDKYSFSILLSNKVTIHFRFRTKLIALRERSKFIRFIETYGN